MIIKITEIIQTNNKIVVGEEKEFFYYCSTKTEQIMYNNVVYTLKLTSCWDDDILIGSWNY